MDSLASMYSCITRTSNLRKERKKKKNKKKRKEQKEKDSRARFQSPQNPIITSSYLTHACARPASRSPGCNTFVLITWQRKRKRKRASRLCYLTGHGISSSVLEAAEAETMPGGLEMVAVRGQLVGFKFEDVSFFWRWVDARSHKWPVVSLSLVDCFACWWQGNQHFQATIVCLNELTMQIYILYMLYVYDILASKGKE